MTLTRVERIMLSNQARILERLYPDEADRWKLVQEALDHGYEWYYDLAFQFVYSDDEVVTSEMSQEVLDILDMFRAMQRAVDALSEAEQAPFADEVTFLGFDGNNETGHLVFTEFLWKIGRFTDVKHEGDDGNSHAPLLDHYRRMLEVWRASQDKWRPTKDEIERILAA